MLLFSVILSLTVLKTWANQSNIAKDSFHEELMIKPLPSGHVYAYFQFTTLWDYEGDTQCEYSNLFVPYLFQIFTYYNREYP